MNQTEFGTRIGGLATSSISAYEKGETVPPSSVLNEIATLGGVTIEGILKGGTNFEEVVSRKEEIIQDKPDKRRDVSPLTVSISDFAQALETLSELKKAVEDATEKLLNYEPELKGSDSLSQDEKRLIVAYRQLENRRKTRLIEDAEEWAALASIENTQTLTK